ncbi:hypothetical protein VDGD_01031 [Verticillium dahliae]|nr:hypothetical protein VdG1_03255 [Verticillium dahliae VDG1]RBQ89937.1 hypothetical protein VDGD_01031 [Verticillium dahliae]
MSCDICGRPHHAQRLPFLCAVDARNHCYDGRMKNAFALLENEKLQKEIGEIVKSSENEIRPGDSAQNHTIAMRYSLSEQRAAEDRTSRIIEQADRLKAEVAAAREEIERRRAVIARRKAELASASNGLAARRARQLEDTERSIQSLNFKWERSADGMARTRAFLCMEAAKLFGLRRLKKSNSPSPYEYRIGSVTITDLSSMHSASPEQLSTWLANVAHILSLASYYLAIRLPAELTLPHRDYPRPTIFNLVSSYRHDDIAFPGTSPSSHFGGGPDGSNNNAPPGPRPRPLYVDKTLPVLAKEDPATYSMFLEAVTLLAYDVSWACCTQGVSIGDRSAFEDVCHIGRNLYNLLIGQQLLGVPTGKRYPSPGSVDKKDGQEDAASMTSWVGRYSHGTARNFLGGAEGADFVKSIKLPGPLKLADKLKTKLSSEVTAPDWEVLQEDAWAEVEDEADGIDARQDKMKNGKVAGDSNKEPRAVSGSGTSGWTKVKSR